MPLSSFPKECFNDVLLFLDNSTLYNCLFINRYLCRLSVPIIWRDPFKNYEKPKDSLISTLMICLNKEELIFRAVHFNNQTPLFEYEKFIKIIHHEYCVKNIMNWLDSSKKNKNNENITNLLLNNKLGRRTQKLVNIIYSLIMRQGSNLQELIFSYPHYFPELSIFTTHKNGIANLRSMNIKIDMTDQNIIEFLIMISKFCKEIVNCELWIPKFIKLNNKPLLDIIILQPLERMSIIIDRENVHDVKKILNALIKFRSETLKDLIFNGFDFQTINLSFLLKFERLERLEFVNCHGFVLQHYRDLFKKTFYLKEFKLWNEEIDYFLDEDNPIHSAEGIINSLCGETLLKLNLNFVTPETVRAVKESCPNISHLQIEIQLTEFLESIIQIICEISSLKILNIKANCIDYDDHTYPRELIKFLGDYLTSVECLFLETCFIYSIDLPSFEYFTNNCKANLKRLAIWITFIDSINENLRIECLKYVDNYQRVHNSLKVLGIKKFRNEYNWKNKELEIIDSLKNQGVEIVSSRDLFL